MGISPLVLVSLLTISVAFSAGANSAALQQQSDTPPDVGSAILQYIKAVDAAMPCGVPALNIPVLAPFTMNSFSYMFQNSYRAIEAEFNNLYATGLNNPEIIKFTYDPNTGELCYDINYPQLQLLGEYSLLITANIAGFIEKVAGFGLLNMRVSDLRFVGNMTLNANAQGYMQITNDNLNFYVGDMEINNWNRDWDIALNNYFNDFVKKFVLMWSQQIQTQVTPFFNRTYLPPSNVILEKMTKQNFIDTLVELTKQVQAVNCQEN